MATMFLVQPLILVICSPRSHLTPVSDISLHVSPKSSISGVTWGTEEGKHVLVGSGRCGEARAFYVGR